MSVNINKIKNGVPAGTKIPMKQCNGNIGLWAESILINKGFPINHGKGTDLPTNLEVKTRNVDSLAPYTIGSMHLNDIIKTPWHLSNVHDKSQRWYFIEFSDEQSVVLDSYILDIRDSYIQKLLEIEYEWGRRCIRNGDRSDCIRRDPNDRYAYWERKNDSSDTWSFRIPDDTLWSWVNIQANSKMYQTFFT